MNAIIMLTASNIFKSTPMTRLYIKIMIMYPTEHKVPVHGGMGIIIIIWIHSHASILKYVISESSLCKDLDWRYFLTSIRSRETTSTVLFTSWEEEFVSIANWMIYPTSFQHQAVIVFPLVIVSATYKHRLFQRGVEITLRNKVA